MQQRIIHGVLLLLSALGATAPAAAQHPVDVQRLTANGEYFVALSTYERMPKRIATTESTIAAARSAWALSLNARAMEEFDRALREGKLSAEAKARIYLSKGIIEFQEGHYQVASLHAERAVSVIDAQGGAEPSSLRAKSYLLWGDSLARLSTFGEAEQRYVKALADASPEDLPQIHFSLGQCRLKLGKYEAARVDFESVPLQHELTPGAIRNLAMIALDTGKMRSAAFWLKKGRAEYPDSFLDSWVDYALVRIAMSENDQAAVREARAAATKKYPPSDPWLNLLQAAAEGFEWARLKPGLGKES